MAPYPTRPEIEEFASSLATSDPSPFFDRVSPDVVWDVMGSHVVSGHYTSLQSWKDGALNVVNGFLAEPLRQTLVNVVGGGDQDWAFLELEANATCKNGMPYHQRYAWALRFDGNGIIVQAKAYLDTDLLQKCYEANS